MRTNEILDIIREMFPNVRCELDYKDVYQLSIAVILSAQTTDVAVNKVTPALFNKYPTLFDLAKADINEVENILKRLGLYRNKARNIILLAQQVTERYDGQIPNNINDLITLAGIGRKSANVILSECFNIPAIAVDTHVERVSKRLKLVPENASVLAVEKILQRKIIKESWSEAHQLFVWFGRYHCKALKPQCNICLLTKQCRYYKQKKNSS